MISDAILFIARSSVGSDLHGHSSPSVAPCRWRSSRRINRCRSEAGTALRCGRPLLHLPRYSAVPGPRRRHGPRAARPLALRARRQAPAAHRSRWPAGTADPSGRCRRFRALQSRQAAALALRHRGLRRSGTENLHKEFRNRPISYPRAPDARA